MRDEFSVLAAVSSGSGSGNGRQFTANQSLAKYTLKQKLEAAVDGHWVHWLEGLEFIHLCVYKYCTQSPQLGAAFSNIHDLSCVTKVATGAANFHIHAAKWNDTVADGSDNNDPSNILTETSSCLPVDWNIPQTLPVRSILTYCSIVVTQCKAKCLF